MNSHIVLTQQNGERLLVRCASLVHAYGSSPAAQNMDMTSLSIMRDHTHYTSGILVKETPDQILALIERTVVRG